MHDNNPLISIIIPCYNYARFLPEAIESALSQRYPNLECIIVNDGSSDNTEEVACKYCKQDVRIKYIKQGNHGLASARNNGIRMAAGKYILPLDADDMLSPDYATRAVEVLEAKPSVGIVYSDAQFIGSTNAKFDLPTYAFPQMLLGNMIFASAFFRKEDWLACGGYNPNMKLGWEDYDFWLSIIERGKDVYKIPETLFYYRQGHSSMRNVTNENQTKLHAQITRNHPELYLNNIETLFQCIQTLQEENTEQKTVLRKIKNSLLYRCVFKQLIEAEETIKRFIYR